MRTTIGKAVFVAILGLFALTGVQSCAATVPSAPYRQVTFQVFYDELSPYGSWVNYHHHGYVWIPSLDSGFIPYSTGGHWVYTDWGWTWASTYHWGWAPFHYGRWLYDDWYGWIWVPGYAWAPAWVVWGSYDYYYGWAPLAPGWSISAGYRPPPHYWVYCPSRYITHINVHRYTVTRGVPHDRVAIIDNYGSNRSYYYGPRKENVEQATGKPVNRITVVEKGAPTETKVTSGRMEIYRPSITKGNATPANVKKLEDVKPVNRTGQNIDVQKKGGDDPVYNRGNQPVQRKPLPDRSGERKISPQQKGNPPVQGRDDIDIRQKAPKRQMPPAQQQPRQEKISPQQKNIPQQRGNIDIREKAAPQQKAPPVQERRPMPQPRPQPQRMEKAVPQQANPPKQEKINPSKKQPG